MVSVKPGATNGVMVRVISVGSRRRLTNNVAISLVSRRRPAAARSGQRGTTPMGGVAKDSEPTRRQVGQGRMTRRNYLPDRAG